jgi:aspartate carbamoyltransferase catalytic subunit
VSWSRRHLLDVDELSAADIAEILDRAGPFAVPAAPSPDPLSHSTRLNGRRVGLLFLEASTRTRTSFDVAARTLGAETFVLDPGTSSLIKGESLVDTVRTLEAIGIDTIVLRHHRAGAPYVAAKHFSGYVVNAGDGWHAHPTQALLDLFTLRAALGELGGKKVAIVGDLRHSRVARSNAWTLTGAGVELWVCGPQPWLVGWERMVDCLPDGSRLQITDDLAAAVRDADAVMALRIQKERMTAGLDLAAYLDRYQVTEQRMTLARPDARFMHPGPVNLGVEVTREVANGPRSLVLEQVRAGVPIRMAVLSLLR